MYKCVNFSYVKYYYCILVYIMLYYVNINIILEILMMNFFYLLIRFK